MLKADTDKLVQSMEWTFYELFIADVKYGCLKLNTTYAMKLDNLQVEYITGLGYNVLVLGGDDDDLTHAVIT